jgi:hypothetical protein
MENLLYLPVSLGEAIDKLTILDIKCDKINDIRKNDVKKEYDILYESLKEFIQTYRTLYETMKKVNLIIWEQMDVLRDGNTSDEEYMKLCKECILSNDMRFRIKNKINLISNSALKEQKSYKINRLQIFLNCSTEYIRLFIEPIRYFSYIYDEIIIHSSNDISELKQIFDYDNTIKYNIDASEIEIKEHFNFHSNHSYTVKEIYEIMNITDKMLQWL